MRISRTLASVTRVRHEREPLQDGPFNPGTRHPLDWKNRWREMCVGSPVDAQMKITLERKVRLLRRDRIKHVLERT